MKYKFALWFEVEDGLEDGEGADVLSHFCEQIGYWDGKVIAAELAPEGKETL